MPSSNTTASTLDVSYCNTTFHPAFIELYHFNVISADQCTRKHEIVLQLCVNYNEVESKRKQREK